MMIRWGSWNLNDLDNEDRQIVTNTQLLTLTFYPYQIYRFPATTISRERVLKLSTREEGAAQKMSDLFDPSLSMSM